MAKRMLNSERTISGERFVKRRGMWLEAETARPGRAAGGASAYGCAGWATDDDVERLEKQVAGMETRLQQGPGHPLLQVLRRRRTRSSLKRFDLTGRRTRH